MKDEMPRKSWRAGSREKGLVQLAGRQEQSRWWDVFPDPGGAHAHCFRGADPQPQLLSKPGLDSKSLPAPA